MDVELVDSDQPSYQGQLEHIAALLDPVQPDNPDLPAVRSACEALLLVHALPPKLWISWLNLEHRHLQTEPAPNRHPGRLSALLHRALFDCPDPSVHALRLSLTPHPTPPLLHDAIWLGLAAHFSEGPALLRALPDHPVEHPAPSPPSAHEPSDLADGCRVFESRLQSSDSSQDSILPVYLSYASYLHTHSPHAAISVYERAVSQFPAHHDLWTAYLDFVSTLDDSDRYHYVATRATRLCYTHIPFWTIRIQTIPPSPTRFVENPLQTLQLLIDQVRPFIMQSPHLQQAARLVLTVWAVFADHANKAPESLLSLVLSTLDFNVHGSTQWASAHLHAAAVLSSVGSSDQGLALFEPVVTARPTEARWWLAFISASFNFKTSNADYNPNGIFERAINSVVNPTYVDLLQDTMLAHELTFSGPDFVSGKVIHINRICDRRREQLDSSAFVPDPDNHHHANDSHVKRRPHRQHNSKETKKRRINTNPKSQNDHDVVQQPQIPSKDDVEKDPNDASAETPKASNKTKDSSEYEVEPRTIYLKNLPYRASEKDIREAFAFAGDIVQVRLPHRSDGVTKGFAYLQFATDESVEKALTKNNAPLLGRSLWVRRSQQRPSGKGKKGKPSTMGGGLVARKRMNLDELNSDSNRDGASNGGTMAMDVAMEDGNDANDREANADDFKGKTQDDFRAMMYGKQ